MARLPRLYFPGCAQHVIQRGNNREACFYSEADYKVYLSFLKDAASKYQVVVHARDGAEIESPLRFGGIKFNNTDPIDSDVASPTSAHKNPQLRNLLRTYPLDLIDLSPL
ncbi:hypothetical protein RPW65_07225 [Pseudomonas sp. NyZ704]|nr:hypothetical protein RPW65_07225 [Pseudomonas sp. NyZ704]